MNSFKIKEILLYSSLVTLIFISVGCNNTVNKNIKEPIYSQQINRDNQQENNETENNIEKNSNSEEEIATHTDNRGNSVGNIANNGYVASYGDWIIYNNQHGGGIYKIKKDGTRKEKLSDGFVYQLNIMDGWIYYVYDNDRAIYRIKMDY